MSYHLAPIANDQQVDANGDPVSGGKIYTYLAGTSTAATTYTDDTGGTAQANPIILNSLGLPANPVWLQSGSTYKFVFTDANDVQTRPTVDDVAGVNDVSVTADQWVPYANAPTYLTATTFSVVGDQTATFQVGRRLKSTNTGGTIYSTITASAFTSVTTVTVANDSGTLDSGMSAVSYGLISPLNGSAPFVQSIATNGYRKLDGGLILQWGTSTTNTSGVASVTFPLAFPTACLSVSTNDGETTAASIGYGGVSFTTTTATLTYARGGAAYDAATVYWFAIGY